MHLMKMGDFIKTCGHVDLEDRLKGIAFNWLSLITYNKDEVRRKQRERYN